MAAPIDKRRPTIREVAKVAQASIGTVSAVINGASRVTEDTRRRIQQAIVDLGYEPNTAARSLKRQRSSSIGLVLPDLHNPFSLRSLKAYRAWSRSTIF